MSRRTNLRRLGVRRSAAGALMTRVLGSPAGRVAVLTIGAVLQTIVVNAVGTSCLAAQSRIHSEVDTTYATVGDRITLTISVDHPADTRVEWPDSLDLAPFEVLDVRIDPAVQVDAVSRSTATLTLAAFELGELEIPSVEVAVVSGDGAREVLATDAYGVEIESVGVDESGDIRDIRGPLGIPMGALRMLLLALLPLLLIAILYTVARRLRSRRDSTPAPALAPLERPAHEVALAALAELEASELLAPGHVKEYHIEVSDILRRYVERRFRVDALEMTTREVLMGLERAGVDESFREGFGTFLDQCDMVKFAKVRPAPDQARQVLELGRRLVQRSAPRFEGAGSTAPEDGDGGRERVVPDLGARPTEPAPLGSGTATGEDA